MTDQERVAFQRCIDADKAGSLGILSQSAAMARVALEDDAALVSELTHLQAHYEDRGRTIEAITEGLALALDYLPSHAEHLDGSACDCGSCEAKAKLQALLDRVDR